MSSGAFEERLQQFSQTLAVLLEPEEPPPTTLQVFGRSQLEQDWQRMLFHFLRANRAHGLEPSLLEHVLEALSDREDVVFEFSRFELEDIRTVLEVRTTVGRPDAITWVDYEWFICWELKVTASEGSDQTQRYVDVPQFNSIGLDKDDIPASGHHYIYLAPAAGEPPRTDAFLHVTWEWMATTMQDFLAESYGAYPTRTTAQLSDFIDTIKINSS